MTRLADNIQSPAGEAHPNEMDENGCIDKSGLRFCEWCRSYKKKGWWFFLTQPSEFYCADCWKANGWGRGEGDGDPENCQNSGPNGNSSGISTTANSSGISTTANSSGRTSPTETEIANSSLSPSDVANNITPSKVANNTRSSPVPKKISTPWELKTKQGSPASASSWTSSSKGSSKNQRSAGRGLEAGKGLWHVTLYLIVYA
jgi:hypothetical protein